MCIPVVLVGGVTGRLFKIAGGRGLVHLVMCAQYPVAQQQRYHEHQRQEAPKPPAGNHSGEPEARHAEQLTSLPFAFYIPPRGM